MPTRRLLRRLVLTLALVIAVLLVLGAVWVALAFTHYVF
jgi:hypothetical protein